MPATETKTPYAIQIEGGAVESHALLAGQRMLLIHHNGETYRLTRTASDKLILTK